LISTLGGKAATVHTHDASQITTPVTTVTGDYWVGQDSTTNGRLVKMNGSGVSTFYVQTFLVNIGDRMDLIQTGTGTVNIAGAGVTLRLPTGKTKLNGQWAAASVICITAGRQDVVVGNLA